MREHETTLDYARRYRELGLWPIPLPPHGKQPPPTGWQHLRLQEWAASADANIGLLTGIDGFCVIDIDDADLARRVLAANPELEKQTTVVHTRKGLHIWLRSQRPPLSRSRISKLKVDLQGLTDEGKPRYVVAPPSEHPGGGTYGTIDGSIRAPLQVGDAEAFLLGLLVAAGCEAKLLPTAPIGTAPEHGSRREARTLVESLPPSLIRLFEEEPGEDWSAALWRLERGLCEHGASEEDAFRICFWAACNKYRRDGRRAKELWQEVTRAFAQEGDHPHKEAQGGLDIRQISEWMQEEEVEWLVEGLWCDRAVGLCLGAQGSYKTWISLDLAVSVASGLPFLDRFRVHRQGPVVLIQQEDRPGEIANRIALIYQAKTGSYVHLNGRRLSGRLPSPPLRELPVYLIPWGFSVAQKGWEQRLEDILRELRPVLVIIDPLYAVGLDVKDWGASMSTELMQPLKRLRELYGTGFQTLHHQSREALKTGTDRPRMGGLGSVLIGASSDAAWAVDRRGSEEEVKLTAEDKTKGPMPPQRAAFTIDRKKGVYRVEVKAAEWTLDDSLAFYQEAGQATTAELVEVSHLPERTARYHTEKLIDMGKLTRKKTGKRIVIVAQGRLPETGHEM